MAVEVRKVFVSMLSMSQHTAINLNLVSLGCAWWSLIAACSEDFARTLDGETLCFVE